MLKVVGWVEEGGPVQIAYSGTRKNEFPVLLFATMARLLHPEQIVHLAIIQESFVLSSQVYLISNLSMSN